MINRRYIWFRLVLLPVLVMVLVSGTLCTTTLFGAVRASADDPGIIFIVGNPDGRPDFQGAPFHTGAVDPVNQTILIPRGQRVRVEGKGDDGRLLVTVIDLPSEIATGTIDSRYLVTLGKKSTFRDVADDHWAASSIASLAKDGIIKGYQNNFMGQKSFSRYEMAVILAPLLRQFRGMQQALNELKEDGTLSRATLSGSQPEGSNANGMEVQLAMLVASIGKLQTQVRNQADRLSSLEDSPQAMAPTSQENVSILKEDLRRLEESLVDLKMTVADHTGLISANYEEISVNSEQFAVSVEQVVSNTQEVEQNAKRIAKLKVPKPLISTSVTSPDNNLDPVHDSTGSGISGSDYTDLMEQITLNSQTGKDNSKIITNVLVKSSVNNARIDSLENAPKSVSRNSSDGNDYSEILEQVTLNTQAVENNSKIMTNVLVKTSVNDSRINALEDKQNLEKDYTELIEQVKNNSKMIAKVVVKSSVNTSKVDEIDTMKVDFSQLVSRLNANSKILANVTVKNAVNEAAIKELNGI